MRVGPEVTRAIVFLESRQPEAWPFLRHVDLDQEKSFVVPKGKVVTRPVLLNQFAFEQDRLRFAAHRVGLKIPNRIEHGARLNVRHGKF